METSIQEISVLLLEKEVMIMRLRNELVVAQEKIKELEASLPEKKE